MQAARLKRGGGQMSKLQRRTKLARDLGLGFPRLSGSANNSTVWAANPDCPRRAPGSRRAMLDCVGSIRQTRFMKSCTIALLLICTSRAADLRQDVLESIFPGM